MCTALSLTTSDFYFGRTLDYEHSYIDEVTITPRNFPFNFRHTGAVKSHYAIIGMAYVKDNFPLYYDAVNEKGLGIAGLNFVGNAYYSPITDGKCNVAQFEFIPYILAQCGSVCEAKKLLEKINITDTPFSEDLPIAQLHFIISDKDSSICVESMEDGLFVYDNPTGVLTNNPPFPMQMFNLNNFMSLSVKEPKNLFSERLSLKAYSRGMGALGLPGDLSSQSRFVRAVFARLNSVSGDSEEESVSQFFHILGTVEQVRGLCQLENGKYEITIYTSCANASRGIYYYTTYNNRQITAVDMHKINLDTSSLVRYSLYTKQQIKKQN